MSSRSASSPSAPAVDARDRKTTLFCQDCSHASPLDGDWQVRTLGDRKRIRCPECRTVVDERRTTDQTTDPDPSVQRCLDAWQSYWAAWTTLFTDERPV